MFLFGKDSTQILNLKGLTFRETVKEKLKQNYWNKANNSDNSEFIVTVGEK
jgi:hypothetical protein